MTFLNWSVWALFFVFSTPTWARNGFGEDNRQVAPSFYPYSAIGLLRSTDDSENYRCTATLVAPDLILTAAHCVTRAKDAVKNSAGAGEDKTGPFLFYPLYSPEHQSDFAHAKVWKLGRRDPWKDRSQDWALLTLDSRLGDPKTGPYGFMNFRNLSYAALALLQTGVEHVGYSHDFPADAQRGEFAGWVKGCFIKDSPYARAMFLNDCTNAQGASGGPVFGFFPDINDWAIIGINVVEYGSSGGLREHWPQYSDKVANGGVYAYQFTGWITEYLAEHPVVAEASEFQSSP